MTDGLTYGSVVSACASVVRFQTGRFFQRFHISA